MVVQVNRDGDEMGRNQPEVTKETLERLHGLEPEELFVELGRAVSPPGLRPRNRKELVEQAHQWYQRNREMLKRYLCTKDIARLFFSESVAHSRLEVTAAVVDCVTAVISGMAAATLAVILVRGGLTELCGENWWQALGDSSGSAVDDPKPS